MITLTIDNQTVEVPEGSTVLQAAQKCGLEIPNLCFAEGFKPSVSCMVCVVRVAGVKHLVPACGTRVTENMNVITQSEEIQTARQMAIELLLSDHVGDCVGPCMRGCPANMNIPVMIRQIASGQFEDAIATVKKTIPFPAILGRICPAPCEKVCRRNQADSSVSICLLKRFVADIDLRSEQSYRPACQRSTGKKVAIVGAGPCGLSAAYYLQQAGIDCTVYDGHEKPGGSLRYSGIEQTMLQLEVLENEINQIFKLDVKFQGNIYIGRDVSIDELKKQYDAVFIAMGVLNGNNKDLSGITIKDNKIQAERPDYLTSREGVFAGGACIGSRNMCIRAVADGKEAAESIRSYLSRQKAQRKKEYNHQMGRLEPEEMGLFLKQASDSERIEPQSIIEGLTTAEAQAEAKRCLHCDCRKADCCGLRDLATDLEARRNVWQGRRGLFSQITAHEQVVFEPGKCIKCGLCIQAAKGAGEKLGLSFEGRGFNMQIVVPLEKTLSEGLQNASNECVGVCPTGALSLKSLNQ